MKPEHLIIRNLCVNEDFTRRTLPFFKDEYFDDTGDLILFRIIRDHITQYNQPPSQDIILAEVSQVKGKGITDDIIKRTYELAKTLDAIPINTNTAWLEEYSEKWCQDRAAILAVHKSIEILNDPLATVGRGAILDIFREALSVTFDSSIGHDYFDDAEARFEARTDQSKRIPFDIEILNHITNGGLPPKTLSIIAGGTNVGKTLAMCSLASAHLAMGYDVLYVTFEMSQEMIGDRIDANSLDVGLDGLYKLQKKDFMDRVGALRRKTMGKLVIKEYPNKSASCQTIRALISELKLKKSFRPHIIYIDYLNIVASARVAMKGTAEHTYVLNVAEEMRALAQQEELPIVSATQFNRDGYGDSNPDMDQIAQSFGLPQTVDFMLALISNDEMAKLGQYIAKQLKSRLGNKAKNRSFVLGVDYDKQRLYDVDQTAYENVGMKDITPKPEEMSPGQRLMAKKPKANFKDFKV
jgi:archaellum biogenesis ATPase FlaH